MMSWGEFFQTALQIMGLTFAFGVALLALIALYAWADDRGWL